MTKQNGTNQPLGDSDTLARLMKHRLKRTDPKLIGSYWTGDLGARLRGLKHNLPQGEYQFYKVADEELEGCCYYESRREVLFLKGKEMLVDGPVDEKPVSEPQFCDQTWFTLDPGDKAEYMRRAAEEKRHSPEPVRLAADLTPLGLRLTRIMPTIKQVELFLDLSWPNKCLERSFRKVLRRLRESSAMSGARSLVNETRGRKGSAKENLLRLSIWRCHKAGLQPKEIIEVLAPFQGRFPVPAESTLSKKIADTVSRTEEWLLA